jgi:hypothetical protein
VKERYEEHHHVVYSDDALQACVKLADRYVTDRFFPDKAIDIIDEVGSHIHHSHSSVPQPILDPCHYSVGDRGLDPVIGHPASYGYYDQHRIGVRYYEPF